MYDTYMSTPGNTAKIGATHSNIQREQGSSSLVGSEPTMQGILLSQLINPLYNIIYNYAWLAGTSLRKQMFFL